MDQENTTQEINAWAFVEVMGHDQLCGLVSTHKLGTQVMFKVDVPHTDSEDGIAYTKFFNPSAIFSITPTTEDYCRRFVKAKAGIVKAVVPFIPEQPKLTLPEKVDDFYSTFDDNDGDDGDEYNKSDDFENPYEYFNN